MRIIDYLLEHGLNKRGRTRVEAEWEYFVHGLYLRLEHHLPGGEDEGNLPSVDWCKALVVGYSHKFVDDAAEKSVALKRSTSASGLPQTVKEFWMLRHGKNDPESYR